VLAEEARKVRVRRGLRRSRIVTSASSAAAATASAATASATAAAAAAAAFKAQSDPARRTRCGAEALEAVCAALPCMREPTISPLHGGAGYAVKAAVPRADLPRIIPELKARGVTKGDLARFQPRINLIAVDIWAHFREHVQPDGF
jgi:ATP phosphoribosyltransferase-like protein